MPSEQIKEALSRLEAFSAANWDAVMVIDDAQQGVELRHADLEALVQMVTEGPKWAGIRGAIDIALAVYGGVEGGRQGYSDAETLNLLANWMDKVDDITVKAFEEAGQEHDVSRDMQTDLRRIAKWIDRVQGANDAARLWEQTNFSVPDPT